MPRQERPLDSSAGPVARFACGLRDLRRRAGSPTYRQMAARAHFSASTLSVAASGSRLPSLEVALAYAQSCGADADEWARRWRATVAQVDVPAAELVRPPDGTVDRPAPAR